MRTKKEDQLAKNIGRLSYDTLVEFTRTISKTIEKEIYSMRIMQTMMMKIWVV